MDLNYIAPINQLGYGIVGLNLLKAGIRQGHRIALWAIGIIEAPAIDRHQIQSVIRTAYFFNPKAPCLRLSGSSDMVQMVGKGLHTGLTIFELNRLTEQERHSLRCLDLAFVPSKWAVSVLVDNGVEEPRARCVPLGVDREVFNESRPNTLIMPLDTGLSTIDGYIPSMQEETTFLNIGKWEYRKGHDVLIRAFNNAFTPQDKVRLVLNCFNPFIDQEGGNLRWNKMYLDSPLGRAGRITVLSRRLADQRNVAALIHTADCGVFPARAEGWNLEVLECMACGKHVIATNYSGHTEFVNDKNALLIEIDSLEDAVDGVFFSGQGQWARLGSQQMDQLVTYLRRVHELKQTAQLGQNTAGIETSKEFSWDKSIAHISAALQ